MKIHISFEEGLLIGALIDARGAFEKVKQAAGPKLTDLALSENFAGSDVVTLLPPDWNSNATS